MMNSLIGALLLFSAMGVLFLISGGILHIINKVFNIKLENLFKDEDNCD